LNDPIGSSLRKGIFFKNVSCIAAAEARQDISF